MQGFRPLQLLLLFGLLVTFSVDAVLFHEIDTTRVLKCTFSSIHHNRIAVDKGRIKKLIYPNEQLYVSSEEESGQVFIQSKDAYSAPTTIAVVTQGGYVQDIEIAFQEIPAEVVILSEPPSCDASSVVQDSPFCPDDSLRVKIEAVMQGKVPDNYFERPFEEKIWKPKLGLVGRTFLKLRGPSDTLYVFEVQNTCRKNHVLLEKDLYCQKAKWIFLEKTSLNPSETLMGMVATDE
jgi:hypothetical protein